jgi:CBS domain containing-hemolysin-like protein
MLLKTSKEHGTIADAEHELLSAMLQVQSTTVRQVMVPNARIIAVDAGADARTVELHSTETGRSRLAVTDTDDAIIGVVHVRDAAKASSHGDTTTARQLMTAALPLPADTSVLDAIAAMRSRRSHLALVVDTSTVIGLVTLEDLLEQVIGQFDDETDPVVDAARRAGRTGTSTR